MGKRTLQEEAGVSNGLVLRLPDPVELQKRGCVHVVQHGDDLLPAVALPARGQGGSAGRAATTGTEPSRFSSLLLLGSPRAVAPRAGGAQHSPAAGLSPHLERHSSLRACRTIRVMFTDMMQKGKFCKRIGVMAALPDGRPPFQHPEVPRHHQPLGAAAARPQSHAVMAAGNGFTYQDAEVMDAGSDGCCGASQA